MRKITLLLLLLPIILVVGLSFCMNEAILRSKLPDRLKTIVILFFPPKDLYDYLFITPYQDSKVNQLIFENKYYGKHEIGILLKDFDIAATTLREGGIPLDGELVCANQGGGKMVKIIKSGTPFWSASGTGLNVSTYHVPDDLPVDIQVTCSLSLDTQRVSNVELIITKVYVQKTSDI